MRGRSIRLSILILFILALSVAALAFREVNLNVPGFPALNRGGAGPLGLKLGLDLSGGGHLVYQADTGSRIQITFAQPTEAVVIEEALLQLGVSDYEITPRDDRSYSVAAGLLDPSVSDNLRKTLTGSPPAEEPEPTNTSEPPATNAAEVQFDFADGENRANLALTVSDAIADLNLENQTVAVWGEINRIRIATDTPLDAPLQQQLEAILNQAVSDDGGQVGEVTIVDFSAEAAAVASGPADSGDDPAAANTLESYSYTEIQPPTTDQMEGVLDTINRRVNLFGTEEPIIQLFGEDRVIVQLPGASGSITQVEFSDPTGIAQLEELLLAQGLANSSVAMLDGNGRRYELRTVSLNLNQQQELRNALAVGIGAVDSFQTTGGIETAKSLIGETAQLVFKERTCSDLACITSTDAELGLTGDDLDDAYASTDPNTGEWEVNIAFNDRGAGIFSDLTQRIVNQQNKRIAVFLDEELLIAPISLAWIRDGRSSISGNFSREEARTLAIQLKAGSLPVPLKLIQESDVDALLGSESLAKSLMAGIIGLALVLVFMVAYYRMAGVVAALALIFYAVVVLAVFKLVPVTLGLSGIGAFILSIGLAVDANILIFERMKEEVRIGRTLASSMEVGFSRAWPAIRDGNFSTIITCLVLLWLGSRTADDLVTGFAFTLFIGVAVSMFTAIVVSRNLLQLFAWIGLGGRVNLFTPEPPPRPATDSMTGSPRGRGRGRGSRSPEARSPEGGR